MRTGQRNWTGMMASALLIAVCSGVASAQVALNSPGTKRELVGVVRDPNGAALEGVSVLVQGTTVRTDSRGSFRHFTTNIDTVTIVLRLVGFDPIDALLKARASQWDTVLVQMEHGAQRLAKVNVNESPTRKALGLRSFDERRARGIGIFLSRDDLTERQSSKLTDLLRTRRGVVMVRGKLRFASSSGNRAACIPDVWLDGQRSQGVEIDDIPTGEVEAVELYANFSTVPFEFTATGPNSTPCGTIVVWTRIPNGKGK
jgi:hypothetical protein